MTKLRQNLAAISVMREILQAGRKPTQAEQEVMALYAGFGGIKEVFNPYVREVDYKDRQKWLDAAKELRRLIGDEAFEAANRSTQNAHYTSPRIGRAMWRMVERLGFTGGRVLEPSMGTGNFLGLTPAHLREKTGFTGVELDPTTGEIARLLYPDANIKIQGFEDTKVPDNFYDLVIGNVPFGAYRVSDPRYNKYHASIHNYFFLRAVDTVRPGGLVALITSTGTLDAPGAQNVRNALYEKADLVGAMRFPSATFRNALTAVVTDLVILRKRLPGEKPLDYSSRLVVQDIRADRDAYRGLPDLWTQTEKVPNPAGGEPIQLNSYLALHRSQMLGEFNGNNRMHPGDANVDLTDDFEQRLEEAIERLPENVMSDRAAALQAEMKEAGKAMKRGAYVVEDGELFRNKDGQLVKVEADARRIQRVEGMLKIRDVLNALTDAEMGRTQDSADTLRKELNTAYDRFAARYGAISDKANRDALEGDPELPRLMSLEDYDSKKKRVSKRPIFFKATIVPPKRDAKPQNITEAVVKSLSLRGEIILPMVAADLGIGEEAAAAQLVGKGIAFQTPAGNWEIAGKYLSGNIRRKLGEARAAAENDPFFEANVKALEAVMPADIPHTAISVQMGAPWIEPSDISQFVAEMFNDSPGLIKVFYDRATGAYQVEMEPSARARRSQETTTTWGTPERPFQDLLDLALQGRAATVTKEVPAPTAADPHATRTVIDAEKTQAANTKLDAIKQRFREWVWEDGARRERLTRRYNEMFNSLRVAEYDASFMGDQVPGMSPDWKLRPHQMAAVLRGITERRGLMAHEVGLGKTLAMIATASELKRLGIAAKPAIAVPKKVLPGFAQTAREAFPLMKLHIVDSRDAEKRQRTMSEIATGDFDLVLMTHDNLNMLKMRPEFEAGILKKELDEVNAVYDILRSEQRQAGGRGTKADAKILATIKKRRENLAAKIKDALNAKLKDDAITFEATGIDFLFVDEFHEYKSYPVVTALGQVKGVPTGDSQRAINMMMRARYLQGVQKGGGLIAATGTPVSNSLVEAYIMAKFLQPEVLEDAGIDAFDSWARNFAEVVSALEFDATGRWKPTSRMSKFKNLPELQTMSRVTLDVKTAKETGILQKRPQRKDTVITIPLDDTQKLFMRYLRERADRLKSGKVDPSEDNYLVVSNDGRLMSADVRLVLPGMENRPSAKIRALVENVTRIHKEKPGTTQMIFCDIGVQPNAWGFRLYGEIMDRLAEAGIPKDKIIDFSKLDSDVKVENAVARLRSGDAIVAIGHRKSMGTGVNAQDKMAAVHQFDTTWKPAMIEQSEARGWRQGNENGEIEILTYVVEGSFDATMWATVARKQQAISSFMRGTVTTRELTEEDGEVLSYEQIAAAASGDQDYLRKAELEQRVFRLAMMKQAHDAEVSNRRQAIPRIEANIAARQRAAEKYDDRAEWAKEVRERAVEYVSSEGKVYTDRAEAAKAMSFDIAAAQKRNKDAKIADQERIYIGEYKGVRVRVETFGDVRGVIPPHGRNHESDVFSINPNFENYAGTLQSFDQSIASIAASNEAKRLREVEIPSLEQDLANLRRIGETPFQHEEELTTAKAQLDRVSKRLAAKEVESENAAEPLVAESGLDVRMTGQLGRWLRQGLREKQLKPSDIPALLERELARIKTETDIAKEEWAEYLRKKAEDRIDRYGLEEVALWEMAKSASRAQRAYGDLYAEQQEQVERDVLKERSHDWQPKPVSHSSSFADIADHIRFRTSKSRARANVIYGNEQAHFWIDRADRRLYSDPSAFNGLNLSPAEARQLAIEIRSEKHWWEKDKRSLLTWLRPSERALYRRADAQIDALANAFEDLADKHDRVIYIRGDNTFSRMRGTLYHELSHNAERKFKGSMTNWFRRAPHADRIAAELDRLGYRESDYISEAVAHLLAGQRWKLKLSLKEAVEFLDEYFANVSFRRGREVMTAFEDLQTAPEMRQTLREAKEKYGPRTGIQRGAGELPPALPGDEGTGGQRSLRDSEPGEASLAAGRQERFGGVSPGTGREGAARRRGAEGLTTEELPLAGEYGTHYTEFSSAQDNSGIGSLGAFDQRDRSITANGERSGLTRIFYSQAHRVIEQKAPNKTSGAQMLAILKNPQNAVKKEELDWLDIEAWLADQRTVTKEAVLSFIEAHGADVRESLRGRPQQPPFSLTRYNVIRENLDDHLVNVYQYRVETSHGKYQDVGEIWELSSGEYLTIAEDRDRTFTTLESAERCLERFARSYYDSEMGSPTLHEDRTLPGSENQRELILTMPGQIKPYKPDTLHFTEDGGGTAVAWIRFNDRVGADGKRILFIEEIQSKRHQDARTHGYQGELPPEWKVIGDGDGGWYTVVDSEGCIRAQSLNRQGAIERATAGAPPAAPFRTSWPELAWKRALRWAVENDYDRVAWTTGEMQAKRYGLSKRIDKLKVLEGRYTEVPGIDGYEVTGWKNGRELLNQRIARDRLPDLIGKEMAETVVAQIEANKQRPVPTYAAVFEGLDLTVGGEGMKYFYDRMLPSFVNRYVKKWGAKVEQEAIPLGSYGFDVRQSRSGLWNVFDYSNDIVHRARTEEQAKAWIKQQGRAEEAVHSITITDKMRESVMLGQPLYERQREIAGREIPGPGPSSFSDSPAIAGPSRRRELELPMRELELPMVDAAAHGLPFIKEALDAGASLDRVSFQHHGSDWTVVSFKNAKGTYLLKGDDVYVTQASVQQAQAAIEFDPVGLRGIKDLQLAGDIEIRMSKIRSTENRIELQSRVVEHSLSM